MRLTPDKKLHSRCHMLADDLSRMMGEEKRFGAYLGIAKRHYERDLRSLARRVLEKDNLPSEARGKYFFAALRGLAISPDAVANKKSKKRIIKKSHAR